MERVSAWGVLRYNEGAGHAEPDPAKPIRRAGSAAVPECSLRARHTRRREIELVSIACSTLHIRRRWVHVPHPFSPEGEGMESGTVHPYRTLQLTRPSVAALLRDLAAERQSLGRTANGVGVGSSVVAKRRSSSRRREDGESENAARPSLRVVRLRVVATSRRGSERLAAGDVWGTVH